MKMLDLTPRQLRATCMIQQDKNPKKEMSIWWWLPLAFLIATIEACIIVSALLQ